MDTLTAIIYGIIQGVTEFAPVSSSGHLALLPHIMQFKDPGVFFDLMMHLGTAFAVICYFHKDIIKYSKALIPAFFKPKDQGEHTFFVRNFCLSTLSTVLVILLIKDWAKLYGRDPKLIAFNLFFFGLILFLSDLKRNDKTMISLMNQKIQWKSAIIIGISQALAIFPGVSRSGITMSAARGLGFNRMQASSFSFLLSLPIIFAGILKELPHYLSGAPSSESIGVLVTGIIVACVFGLLTIHFFLKLMATTSLLLFFIYRSVLALALFLLII